MDPNSRQRICLVTGAGGFLGGCVKNKFAQEGWKVVELVRQPTPEDLAAGRAIQFELGKPIAPEFLDGADALVHCAQDFSLRDWNQIHAINVLGAEKLFASAEKAGVARRVFISSMSAYDGCKSLYGQSKLEVEQRLKYTGAFLPRPGLIYGEPPGGIFAKLVLQVEKSSILPLFGAGSQILYMTHVDDLCAAIHGFAMGELAAIEGPVTVAHEQGWTLRGILEEVARARGKRLRFIRLPWRPLWLMLKCGECCGLKLNFRSDSLLSLMHQNLHPSFEAARELKLEFRPFRAV